MPCVIALVLVLSSSRLLYSYLSCIVRQDISIISESPMRTPRPKLPAPPMPADITDPKTYFDVIITPMDTVPGKTEQKLFHYPWLSFIQLWLHGILYDLI